MKIIQNITLDLEGMTVYSCMIRAKEADDKSRCIRATLTAGGTKFMPPSGATAKIRCLKGDGHFCIDPATIEEEGTILCELTAQMLACAGYVVADICLYDKDGSILSTATFTIVVEAAPGGQAIASSNEFLELRKLIEDGKKVLEDLEQGTGGIGAANAFKLPAQVPPGLPEGTEANTQAVLNALADAITGGVTPPDPTSHSITYRLTKVSSSNRETSVKENAPYTTTLTADEGLLLSGVTVTMGGKNITAEAWKAPTVTIAAVTGDVVITATGASQIDTSPKIAGINRCLGRNGEIVEQEVENACYTEFYEMKGPTVIWLNNDAGVKFSANGKLQVWDSQKQVTNWSVYQGGYVDKEFTFTDEGKGGTKFRASLSYPDREKCYAYDKASGNIYFAGKETKYYGMSNIHGAPPEPGTISKAEVIDLAYSMNSLTQSKALGEYGSLPQEFVDMVKANYAALKAEAFGDFDKIPFIAHTDQHAQFRAEEPAYKLIGDLADWFEISSCLNLGDTCGNCFNEKQLETYFQALEGNIPYSKRVECYGNHDVWVSGPDGWIYTAPQGKIAEYLKTIYAHRESNNGYFTVVDPYYRVKYLVISDYEYAADIRITRMSPQQCDFLVRELSADDGLDIIICSHQPLDMNKQMTTRDPDFFAFDETFLGDKAANASFLQMVKARHDLTAGTFTDSDGVEHPYDFAGLKSKLLFSMHGHEHFEAYYTLPGSITEFVFDYYKPDKTFYWGYVDRKAMKLVVWKNALDAGNGRLEVQLT